MTPTQFADREDAGSRLAKRLVGLSLSRPLVLAIPRGGIEIGAPLARALAAELDVVLSRKLGAPGQHELALGAVSESGEMHLDPGLHTKSEALIGYLEEERARQMAEIERHMKLFRALRPKAEIAGRSVIITDDGIATGSTMIAALTTVRAQQPHEIIVAVPVAPRSRLEQVRPMCQRLFCLCVPEDFWAVGQFYGDFREVPDERVVQLLRELERSDRARRAEGTGTSDPRSTLNT
jgi:putative phosphoribosyl transferase